MVNLKQYLIGILLVEFLIKNGVCNQFRYIGGGSSTQWTYEDARDGCLSFNMSLPVVETREEYQDFWDFMTMSIHKKDLWLGLQWNYQDGGFYQWLNGNILGVQNWGVDQPQPQPGKRCVFVDVSKKWYSALCTINRFVICYFKDGTHDRPPDKEDWLTDFYSAYRACTNIGGTLPVILKPADLNRFLSLPIIFSFWLGLVENKDQFVWITGNYLGYYSWKDGERGELVHAHQHNDSPYVEFHAPLGSNNADPRYYFCQEKKTKNDNAGLWGHNYFKMVEKSVYALALPRTQGIVGSGPHCAVICSRDVGCLKYTVDGEVCRTYGNDMEYAVFEGGVPLYERIRGLQQLIQ